LATDLAPLEARPKVVALMYVMLLVGAVFSGLIFGLLLTNFSEVRLIQVIQGSGLLTMGLNLFALWKQEARDPARARANLPRPPFRDTWRAFCAQHQAVRFMATVLVGTAAFNMQDIMVHRS
jgi:BCD family chlorophyll transporter-like MFS transporter